MTETTADTTKKQSGWLRPGTRKWFWVKRLENSVLFFMPLLLLKLTVGEFREPGGFLYVQADQEKVIVDTLAVSQPADVTSVSLKLVDPSIWDRITASLPLLILTVGMACLCHALWRIEINLTAGGRPYTAKDDKIYKRALLVALAALVGGCFTGALPVFLGDGFPEMSSSLSVSLVVGLMMLYGATAAATAARRMYIKGREAYEELEKGV